MAALSRRASGARGWRVDGLACGLNTGGAGGRNGVGPLVRRRCAIVDGGDGVVRPRMADGNDTSPVIRGRVCVDFALVCALVLCYGRMSGLWGNKKIGIPWTETLEI